MKKHLKIILLIVAVIIIGLVASVIVLSNRRPKIADDTVKPDISWQAALEDINNCKVTDISYGGGLVAPGQAPPSDTGYLYLTYQDGRQKIAVNDQEGHLNNISNAAKRCGIREVSP